MHDSQENALIIYTYTKCSFCQIGNIEQATENVSVQCCVKKFKNENFMMWRCPNCQMIHAKEFVDLNKYCLYFPLHRQKVDLYLKKFFKNRLKLLNQLSFNKNSYLLDYGCGSGHFIRFLQENGYDNTFGYDPFSEMYSNKSVLNAKYDYVTSQDVIEHAGDPSIEASMVSNILANNGCYIVGTPNAKSLNISKPKIYQVHLGLLYHRHLFTSESLSRFCNS